MSDNTTPTTHVPFTVALAALSAHHPAGQYSGRIRTSDSGMELDAPLRRRYFLSQGTREIVDAAAQAALDAHFDAVAGR